MIIKWLGHASFIIYTADKTIYIDPYAGEEYDDKADIILVTHGHYDHSSKEKIEKVRLDETVVLTTLQNSGDIDGRPFGPGQEFELDSIKITAVPAYNIGKVFHPQADKGIGFIIESEGKSVYHAGDTDLIPEMDNLNVTVALLPVGGTYTMDAKAAAVAAVKINAKTVIPMHYGSIVGTLDDAEHFKELIESSSDIKVEILEPGKEIEIKE